MNLFFHFVTIITMTVLVSLVIMRRYAAGVSRDMTAAGPAPLDVAPGRSLDRIAPLTIVEVQAASITPPAARDGVLKERSTRRAIVAAYLVSTGLCGAVIAIFTLSTAEI